MSRYLILPRTIATMLCCCYLMFVLLLLCSPATAFLSQPATTIRPSPLQRLEATHTASSEKINILICPAQFCVPEDYNVLIDYLINSHDKNIGGDNVVASCRAAPLPRTAWIQVAKQLPTSAFWQGSLSVQDTLYWYFDAMDQAISEMIAENPDGRLCIIGHSMGGWVARAYLGGLSASSTAVNKWAQDACTSLITLGTPHIATPDAWVDQTRGLLSAIAAEPSCSAQALLERGIDITCVCSQAIETSVSSLVPTSTTRMLEQAVAATSYLPLLGRVQNVKGDGIVPLDLAFLPETRHVVLDTCQKTQQPIRHIHVVPTPWNLWNGYAPSIALPHDSFPSYVSEGVVSQWAKYIR